MECEINLKWLKRPIFYGIIFGIVLIIIWNYFLTWPLTILHLNEEIMVDKEISKQYNYTIKPEGNQKITDAVNNISKFSNTGEKLNSILDWELQDWINPRWRETYKTVTCYDSACRYVFFDNNIKKMRADVNFPPVFGTIYYPNDPAWITYHKTGACQEISVLFAEIAKRSGYQTQTVYCPSHQWPEVYIDGEWWYYDPVCAYEKYHLDKTKSNMWFNKTEYFRMNCYSEAVVVFDSKRFYDFTPTLRYYF
jgi:hypothetical protein